MQRCRNCLILVMLLGMALSSRAAEPLMTQPTMDGQAEVDVLSARVKDGVLMVVLAFRNLADGKYEYAPSIDDAYFVDAKNQKKYQVIRDDKGYPLASPAKYHGEWPNWRLEFVIKPRGKQMVWLKFPAPPEDATSVDLTLPDVLPFDGLPVQR